MDSRRARSLGLLARKNAAISQFVEYSLDNIVGDKIIAKVGKTISSAEAARS